MPSFDESYFYKAFKINENMDYEQMIFKIAEAGMVLTEDIEI